MEKLFGQKGRNSRAFLGDARIYIPRIYDCQRIKIHVLLVENERNSVIRHSLWTARGGGGLAHWGGAPGGSPRGRARTRRSRSRWTGAGPPPPTQPLPNPLTDARTRRGRRCGVGVALDGWSGESSGFADGLGLPGAVGLGPRLETKMQTRIRLDWEWSGGGGCLCRNGSYQWWCEEGGRGLGLPLGRGPGRGAAVAHAAVTFGGRVVVPLRRRNEGRRAQAPRRRAKRAVCGWVGVCVWREGGVGGPVHPSPPPP